MAEGEGFEPSRRYNRLRDFQSRALGQAMRPFRTRHKGGNVDRRLRKSTRMLPRGVRGRNGAIQPPCRRRLVRSERRIWGPTVRPHAPFLPRRLRRGARSVRCVEVNLQFLPNRSCVASPPMTSKSNAQGETGARDEGRPRSLDLRANLMTLSFGPTQRRDIRRDECRSGLPIPAEQGWPAPPGT